MYETDNIVWYDFPGQEKYGLLPVGDSNTINLVIYIYIYIYMYDLTSKISYKSLYYWKNMLVKTMVIFLQLQLVINTNK